MLNATGITDLNDWAAVTRENRRSNNAELYGHRGGPKDLIVHGLVAFKRKGGTPDELRQI